MEMPEGDARETKAANKNIFFFEIDVNPRCKN
jgi:hypothetical protein